MPIAPGQPAPDIELPDQKGNPVRLSDLWSRGPVVLFFYPKDNTAGCTKEACAFRDNYTRFIDAGAQVIGISSDSVESHRRFAAEYNLPFTLLSDKRSHARKAFRVRNTLGIIPGRVTFVIGSKGIVHHVFNSGTRFEQHAEEALKGL